MGAREIVRMIAIAGVVSHVMFFCMLAAVALMEFFTRNK